MSVLPEKTQLVDHLTGLSNGIQDQSVPEYLTAVTGVVKLAEAFNLPSVITTSAADGPNGPVLPVITKTLPNAPVVKGADGKQGEDGCEIRTDVFDTDLGENCGWRPLATGSRCLPFAARVPLRRSLSQWC